jgi:hypothetical protein
MLPCQTIFNSDIGEVPQFMPPEVCSGQLSQNHPGSTQTLLHSDARYDTAVNVSSTMDPSLFDLDDQDTNRNVALPTNPFEDHSVHYVEQLEPGLSQSPTDEDSTVFPTRIGDVKEHNPADLYKCDPYGATFEDDSPLE